MQLNDVPKIETEYLDIGPTNADRIVRNSCGVVRTMFGDPEYSAPAISLDQAAKYARHALIVEMCGVHSEQQKIEVRTSLPTRVLQFENALAVPDSHLVQFLTTPIAHAQGLTAQHSENYQGRIRGLYPCDHLQPDHMQTVSGWMKDTIKRRFDQLCLYMEGRHTWDELADYWQRLLPKK